MLHELIPEGERYDVRKADLDWWRYGEPQKPVLNERTCTQGAWAGVKKVFPDANFYKKPGRVTDYAIDLHYVEDLASGTYYVAAIGTESTEKTTLESIAEEIARMMKTPDRYVYLASLKDNVNPVRANLWVYTTEAGTLDLAVAPQGQGGDPIGWSSLSGSTLTVDPGGVDLEIVSDCLDQSLTYDVLGRLSTSDGVAAFSDLHYVIVNSTISCP